MNTVVFLGINTDLGDGYSGGKKGMVGKENVIEINLSSLLITDKISISIINSIKQEASKVHGNKIKVHSFDTEIKWNCTS